MKTLVAIALFLISSLTVYPASACPNVGSLADLNCDGDARVVVLGDSLVFGIGDKANGGSGGYVLRTQTRFPGATISSFGIPGLKTLELLQNVSKAFAGTGNSELADALLRADLVVLDLGRNDRWLFGLPSEALRNLNRITTLIKQKVRDTNGTTPIIVKAVLMLPNRGAQGPWVKELNALILRSNTISAPADLRFDLVSKRLLSQDQIHPTSLGYKALAQVFIKYLLNRYPVLVNARRPAA